MTRPLSLALVAAMLLAAPATPALAKKAPKCAGKRATIVSSAAVITGTPKRDIIYVKGNRAHTVVAGAGNDIICGSAGPDTIAGGPGNDVIMGLGGNDVLTGDLGDDTLRGGPGSDELDGNDGTDIISGGTGVDVKHLGTGDTDADASDGDVNDDDSVQEALTSDQQALAVLLRGTVSYLEAGIFAGDIVGTGAQSVVPSAPHVARSKPVDSRIKHVVWAVSGDTVQACVDGTVDGVESFKVRLDPRDGSESLRFAAGDGDISQTARTFTTGICGSIAIGSNVPSGAASDLEVARDQVVSGLLNGSVTGVGDTDFALYVGTTTPSSNYLVNQVLTENVLRIQWHSTAISSGTSTAVCIDTVVNPYADDLDFYSYNGTVTVTTSGGLTHTTVVGTVVHDFCAPLG